MSLITPAELKELLKLQGVVESDIPDDTTLENLIELKLNEIIGITGLPVKPVIRKQIIKHFKGDIFETSWYPVGEICEFKIDGVDVLDTDYVFDDDNGIIFFNKYWSGLLYIKYVQKASSDVIIASINPLVSDMVLYSFKNNDGLGDISSIHEMDTSISYDTSNNLGNRIYLRINELKDKYNGLYSARVRWL